MIDLWEAEFQSLGKRWKKVLHAADKVLEEWINLL